MLCEELLRNFSCHRHGSTAAALKRPCLGARFLRVALRFARFGGIGFIQTLEFIPFPPDGKWIYSWTKKKREKERRGCERQRAGKEERGNKKTSIPLGTNGDRRAYRFHTHNKLLERPEALIYRGVSPGAVFFRRSRAFAALKNIFLKANISLGPIFRRVNNIRARRDNKVGCHVSAIAKRGCPGKKNESLAWPNAHVIFSHCLPACLPRCALLPPDDDVQDQEKSLSDENEISIVDDRM